MMDMELIPSERSIPQLDWGMPVEVMRDFDTVLLFGKLAAVSPDRMTIKRMSSELCFPIVKVDSALLIRCYDIRRDPVLLRVRVTSSSGTECTVGDLMLIPYKTQRKGVRYPLCPPASVSVLDGTAREQLLSCQLLNISVGGACIVTGCGYDVGQALQLQIRLAETDRRVLYPCKVMRVTPRRGGRFEYGLLFEHLTKEQLRDLSQILREWFTGRRGVL